MRGRPPLRCARPVLLGLALGFAAGMPLFEVSALVVLAVHRHLVDASGAIRFFSDSANVLGFLTAWHMATAAAGALLGALWQWRERGRRPRLRVIRGGAGRRRRAG